jgi:hypothetical protein
VRPRDIVDDRQGAPEDDGKADPRLPVVAQVPEQERRGQPDDPDAADERDEQSVDERQRRGDEPVGRGRGERESAGARTAATRAPPWQAR